MIFVDTSVWVAAFRKRESPEAVELTSLLDADRVALAMPVRIELLSGASKNDRARLRRILSALPTYLPSKETWTTLDRWVDTATDAGQRLGMADLLVAAVAAENGGAIWSPDSDFGCMARLRLVELHVPA